MSAFTKQMGAAGLVVLSLAACGGSGVKPPEPKVNPSPRERYEITLIVEDPPASYRIGDVWVQMDIPNLECVPLADRIAGYRPNTSARQPFEFSRKAENTYVGYIYADYFMPEDYYGQGVCQWKISTAHADILMSGLEQAVYLDEEEVTAEGSAKNFCRRPESKPMSPGICFTPLNKIPTENEKKFNYFVVMKSRRMF